MDVISLQKTLGVSFNDRSFLEHALIHTSYVNENPDAGITSNERLEFLGDAVLGLISAEALYLRQPNLDEGQMTKIRSALVSREALVAMATAHKIGDYLKLGRGEEAGGGRKRPLNLASAMEAVIAAVYLDRGLPAARDFVLRLISPELENVINQGDTVDYKSQLQELMQAKEGQRPEYVMTGASGPDHNPKFTVEVRFGDQVLGRGSGRSKKAAEVEAARDALGKIH
jgi:ribonuclease-3